LPRITKISQPPWSWGVVEDFLTVKRSQGRSERTLKDYRETLLALARVGEDPVQAAREYLGRQKNPSSYNVRLSYLRSFFSWCASSGLLKEDPTAGLRKRRAPGRVVQLDDRTLKALLSLPDRTTWTGMRDYCLLALQLDTGIRPGEALKLTPQDFLGSSVRVRPEVAKARVERVLPVSPPTARAIQVLLKNRHPSWTGPILCSNTGKPLDSRAWYHRLSAYGKRLGVAIRPYDLRHAFALSFLRNGGHALALKAILGHSDLAMTSRYVALTQQDLLQQAVYSPLRKLSSGS